MVFEKSEMLESTPVDRLKSGSPGTFDEAYRPGQVVFTGGEQLRVAAGNAPVLEHHLDACVPQLVAMQAAATPGAVALGAGNRMLRYDELNRRANQLAHYLQTLGVGPQTLVALCVERSFDMVVGLLGILKAGGAYVPLDPAYPPERLAFMLADSAAPIVVTRQSTAEQLPGRGPGLVCFDADSPALAAQSESDPVSAITADDLAYVIYTSGSTGRPKGVQITHRSLLNLVFWHQRAFAVTYSDRATQVSSPAFDATGWELWPYLTCGASVSLPDEETRLSPLLLRDWMLERRITIAFLPTALAESTLALEWPSTTALRFLLTGADTLHRYPSPTLPFALINNYGPTEATVVATSGHVPPGEHADGPPSIGVPIAHTQVYLLDEQLRPVPDGDPGNCISGELAWPRAISTAQTSLLSASSHIRLAPSPPRGCTRRATWDATCPTGRSRFWDAMISRSNCGGTGSSPLRSSPYSMSIPPSRQAWSWRAKIPLGRSAWSRISYPSRGRRFLPVPYEMP